MRLGYAAPQFGAFLPASLMYFCSGVDSAVIGRPERPRPVPPVVNQIGEDRADKQHAHKAKPHHEIAEQRDQDHGGGHDQRRYQQHDADGLDSGVMGASRKAGIEDRTPQGERRPGVVIRQDDFRLGKSLAARRHFDLGHGIIVVAGLFARSPARAPMPR
jgi:hypothetical protein